MRPGGGRGPDGGSIVPATGYATANMDTIKQLGIIIAVCLAGECLADALPAPFPGSVMAMAIMLVLLFSGALGVEQVEKAADFLLANMAFLFVPVGVSVITCLDLVRGGAIKLAALVIATTVITFAAAAFAAKLAMLLLGRGRGGSQ